MARMTTSICSRAQIIMDELTDNLSYRTEIEIIFKIMKTCKEISIFVLIEALPHADGPIKIIYWMIQGIYTQKKIRLNNSQENYISPIRLLSD